MRWAAKLEGLCILVFSVVSLRYAYIVYAPSSEPLGGARGGSEPSMSPRRPDDGVLSGIIADDLDGSRNSSNSDYFHFVQVTDIHVRRFPNDEEAKPSGLANLIRFIRSALPVISPEFVIATGDLIDAKDKSKRISLQYIDEWKAYHDALKDSGVLARRNGMFWWDLRGNHDCFNVHGWNSHNNFYTNFSATRAPGFAFQYAMTKTSARHLFVGIDMCPGLGLGRPYNFFATVEKQDQKFAENELAQLRAVPGAGYAFAFSHYPLSLTLATTGTKNPGVFNSATNVFAEYSMFMCGHLHRLKGGNWSRMYARKASGLVELELGDMKSHGMFRVVVVDGGEAVFKDVSLSTIFNLTTDDQNKFNVPLPKYSSVPFEKDMSPVIVITAPADGRFLVSKTQGPSRRQNANQAPRKVRAIIFTNSKNPGKDLRVSVKLDGVLVPEMELKYIGNRIWERAIPKSLMAKFSISERSSYHEVLVIATDARNGAVGETVSRFQNNNVLPLEGGFGEFVIAMDFVILSKLFFAIGVYVVHVLLVPTMLATRLLSRRKYSNYVAVTCKKLRMLDAGAWRFPHSFVPDLTFFLHVTPLRFCEFARVSPGAWYTIYLSVHAVLHGPLLIGEMLGREQTHAGRKIVAMYATGARAVDLVNTQGDTMIRLGAFQPMGDSWFFAFTLIWSVFVPLLLYLSLCSVPPQWIYDVHNARHNNPLHRHVRVRQLAVLAVCYHAYNYIMHGVFYGWLTILVSPLGWYLVGLLVALVSSVKKEKRLRELGIPEPSSIQTVADAAQTPSKKKRA